MRLLIPGRGADLRRVPGAVAAHQVEPVLHAGAHVDAPVLEGSRARRRSREEGTEDEEGSQRSHVEG
jgi:hypothetical protein